LALYEAVHLNRNFTTTLTTVPADFDPDVSSNIFNGSANDFPVLKRIFQKSIIVGKSNMQPLVKPDPKIGEICDFRNCCLLEAFITQASVIFGNLKPNVDNRLARLCAIILTCITEDQYANTLMHDVNLTFKVCVSS